MMTNLKTKTEIRPDRPIPINLAAERSVLGALIEDGSLLEDVIAAGLRVEDFALSDHRRVYAAMLDLWQQKKPVDYVLVADHLGNDQEHYVLVGSLIQGVIVDPDHVLHHVEIVRRKSQLRSLLRIAEWITNVVNDQADPNALIGEAIAKLEAVATSEVHA
jgi:replicative DNA helicase